MNEEEYEGVTLYVDAEGWPNELAGLILKEQIVYMNEGKVKIVGDPIWRVE